MQIRFKSTFLDLVWAVLRDMQGTPMVRFYLAGFFILGWKWGIIPFPAQTALLNGICFATLSVPLLLGVWLAVLFNKGEWAIGEYKYSCDQNGIWESYQNKLVYVEWKDVARIKVKSECLLIYLKNGKYQMIPKSAQRIEGDIVAFEQELRARIPSG